MQICEVENRDESLIAELTGVWERSVKATHLFLSAAEIAQIKNYVPQALGGVAHLMVGEIDGKPVAFMSRRNSVAKGLAGSLWNTPLQTST